MVAIATPMNQRMLPPEDAEDVNMQLLEQMKEDGDDLTAARDIDYNHLKSQQVIMTSPTVRDIWKQ